jgi:antagonist of KipI
LSLVVIKPGLHTTVQDHGRPGYRAWGVPVGGAFDVRSHDLANAHVGNDPEAASLELTLQGGTFEAECNLAIALAGAPMDAIVRRADGAEKAVFIPRSLALRAGDRLLLGGTPVGARTYLAVAGGWSRPVVLGSRSGETPLGAGDRLRAAPGTIAERRPADPEPLVPPDGTLRVIAGPNAAAFGLADNGAWDGRSFRVSGQSNRMGLRLENAAELPADPLPDRISAPVAPGTVQVAGGRLIVLGVACGTMGGYPHVAQVIQTDLPSLGQFRPGDLIRFQLVSLASAREITTRGRNARHQRLECIRAMARDSISSDPS